MLNVRNVILNIKMENMKIKTIYKIWFYGIAAFASFFLAYTHWEGGNIDAAIAWMICGGAQSGTAGTYHTFLCMSHSLSYHLPVYLLKEPC